MEQWCGTRGDYFVVQCASRRVRVQPFVVLVGGGGGGDLLSYTIPWLCFAPGCGPLVVVVR